MSVLITERRSERRSELNTKVGQILNRHPTVGLAVGIIGNGRLQFFGHGLADIASNTPITEDTVFRIGSLTKTFTAVAVMQLWEQGLGDLDVADDARSRYGPGTRRSARPALVTSLAGPPAHGAGSRVRSDVYRDALQQER
jgi:CubicO group peptidase (beta-lactamase class C family)